MSIEYEKFKINYSPVINMDLDKLKNQYVIEEDDIENNYNPFNVYSFQNYIPTYNNFFNMEETNYNNICLNNKKKIIDLQTLENNGKIEESNIFIKHSPLLDPIRYMVGKYDISNENLRKLPNLKNKEESHSKLTELNNSSYVDGFFSFLSSMMLHNYKIKNCIDYYGSFLAVQEKYKMNITDDYDYLHDSNFFLENLNKHWNITKYDMLKEFMSNNSRCNRNKLNISNTQVDESLLVDEFLEKEPIINENIEELEEIYENKNIDSSNDESTTESSESDTNESESEEESDEDEDEESDSLELPNDINIFAYIKNFPVQMICLEKCDGTLDSLFEESELDEDTACSALFQVIMILIIFQKAFNFTHNDLHTNNIMYSNTELEYLYYKFEDKYYKVPTYGKIFKLIDFGRSIYKFQGKIYCSDSFAPGGDASTQYNCEPYYNDSKPIIEPNMSFDLCRLGCSIYDFIIDEEEYEEMDELQKTIYRWCLDDDNNSILYKKNGSDRFPEFKLYKMIARIVHNHTPQKQLEFEYFNKYEVKQEIQSEELVDIDKLHSYI